MAKSGFHEGRLGIGLTSEMGMGDGNPRYPLDINGDIRLTGAIVNAAGEALNMAGADSTWQVDANNIIYNPDTPGNVGIGNTIPSYKLDLSTAGYTSNHSPPAHYIRFSSSYGDDTSSGGIIWKSTFSTYSKISAKIEALGNGVWHNQRLAFFTTDTGNASTDCVERMCIDANGNVGIGTASPEHKCSVNFTGSSANTIDWGMVINNNAGATQNNVGCGSGIKFRNYYDNTTDGRWAGIASVSEKTYSNKVGLVFYTAGDYESGGATTEKMRIDNQGNVGIGNTIPSYKLDLSTAGYTSNHSPPAHYIRFSSSYGDDTSSGGIIWKSTFSTYSKISAKIEALGNGVWHNQRLAFFTTDTGNASTDCVERMCIDANGNVGIGITNPGAYKLNVAGNTNITGTLNVTSTIYGTLQGTATNATKVTIADESSDESCYPLFATAATGTLPCKIRLQLSIQCKYGSSVVHNI